MFGGNPPAKDRTPLNVQTYRASSNESAKPVPYLCGKNRLALNFISDIFDEKAVAVTQTVGKQKSKAGYNYYASFAAVACHGIVYGISDILLNSDSVYAENTTIRILSITRTGSTATATTKNAHGLVNDQNVLIKGTEQLEYQGTFAITVTDPTHFTYEVTGTPHSPATTPDDGKITARVKLDPILRDEDHPDYVDITIPDYGVVRIYWGTETQLPDGYLQTSGVAHPAYRGLCYFVFNQLFLGFNQTNVQNIEVVLMKYPTTSWLSERIINEDANLVGFSADLLQDLRIGCGLPDDRIDIERMLYTAATLDEEGFGISPILTREQKLQEALTQAFEYAAAYPSLGPNGTIGIRLVRPPNGQIPDVTDSDLLEKPTFETTDWGSTINETRIRFTNRLLEYKEDALGRPDMGARAITGEPSSQTIDRPFITDEDLAEIIRISENRSASIPSITGRAKLRKTGSLFEDLAPGEPFAFNYSLRNLTGIVFRVDKRTWSDPAKAEFEIEFHADRSYLYRA